MTTLEPTWYRRAAEQCREAGHFKVLHEEGDPSNPYLERFRLQKEADHSVYLHRILRSDNSPDYHDHPWPFTHMILDGSYEEQYPDRPSVIRRPGSLMARSSSFAHRLELPKDERGRFIEVWTLVIVGVKERDWGFIDRNTGIWTPWEQYVAKECAA